MQLSSDLRVTYSDVEGKKDLTWMSVAGRINMGNAQQLETAAQAAYASGAHFLLLDLSECDSLTSAGLRAVLSIYKLFQGQDAGATQVGRSPFFKLLVPGEQVRNVLKIAGYDAYLDIFSQRQDALAAFA